MKAKAEVGGISGLTADFHDSLKVGLSTCLHFSYDDFGICFRWFDEATHEYRTACNLVTNWCYKSMKVAGDRPYQDIPK